MVTGDPAWKEFERISFKIDRENADRNDANYYRNFVLPVLELFREADCYTQLMWKINWKASRIEFGAFFGDVFGYAGTDVEPIETATDVARLNRCLQELKKAAQAHPGSAGTEFLPELYAARRRKRRPLQIWLDRIVTGADHKPDPAVLELFNEIPEYKGKQDDDVQQADASAVRQTGSPGETEGLLSRGDGAAG